MFISDPITEVRITVNKKKIQEGSNMMVTCTTDGYPLSDYVSIYECIWKLSKYLRQFLYL